MSLIHGLQKKKKMYLNCVNIKLLKTKNECFKIAKKCT